MSGLVCCCGACNWASIWMPHSRVMPSIGPCCHELRLIDSDFSWRIIYAITREAIVVLDVFPRKTRATPSTVVATCRRRLAAYRRALE
ncbi:type II toxin-antitoxin system RelE/ParE family toxin [Povalibacter sp.]|uniref:type II toxin-antitoxin system RelE/ParE family toxin n=1 Tax=Povalibacter sp. TaxID=1962978 RepID=UPI002F429339